MIRAVAVLGRGGVPRAAIWLSSGSTKAAIATLVGDAANPALQAACIHVR
jgi:hypothetical protein